MNRLALVRFVARLDEPGGVSTPAPPGRDDIDLAIDRDPWSRPHLPGTSLAGALRALVRDYAGDEVASQFFGRLTPKDPASTTVDAVASAIWVLGSTLMSAEDPRLGVRQSTAIDRDRGAALAHTLRREEVLAAGSRFEVFLRWDDPDDGQLADFLAHLAAWRPLLGHGVTRGRGRVRIDEVGYGLLDLQDADDLARWLRSDGPDLLRSVATRPAPAGKAVSSPDRLQIPVTIDGPLRVGTGQSTSDDGAGVAVARVYRDGDRIVIPGSGLKGLLRSRCEFILRSVGVRPRPCLDQRCGQCWPCGVFGYGGGDDPAAHSVGFRGLVRVLEAVVTTPSEVDPVVRRTHVAVDRFTGGARDEQLFTVEALESGTFTLTIELLAGLTPVQEGQLRALLRLVLADLGDGLVGIGSAVTRGYGSVTPALGEVAPGTVPDLAAAQVAVRDMLSEGTRR